MAKPMPGRNGRNWPFFEEILKQTPEPLTRAVICYCTRKDYWNLYFAR